MKRWTVATALAAVAVLGGVIFLHGQTREGAADSKEKRTIHTSGAATLKVKPDSARVFFGVQSVAPTIKEAREDNNHRVKAVMDALIALQIPDLKAKTTNVRVDLLQVDHNRTELPRLIGYRITNTFSVLVKNGDPDKLAAQASKVLDTALEKGANEVQQIVFFKEDDQEIRRQALTKAVGDALANAKALAQGGNVQVHETIQINGEPQFAYYPDQMVRNAMVQGGFGGEGGTAIALGDLEITCRVSITCSY